jgi:4-amino-4-deoxy-L-arabinose transferase-like glycosyltransferase
MSAPAELPTDGGSQPRPDGHAPAELPTDRRSWWRRDARTLALPGAIVALAAILRLWAIGHGAQNPFYDAAVHSMALSWHNFFFGALDPSAKLAIDKPPVDLWLQVVSTKVFGFNRTALALPEALGGIAAVGLLYGAVRSAYGDLAGALAALALAVLPIAVLTSRSDTMDSVMSALLVAALWSSIVAVQRRQARYVLLGAALVGVAFDVKLTQALVPLPALALMWWGASRPRRRLSLAIATAAVLVSVAMAWAFTASLTPLSGRPFPMGSRTGSIYRAIFVYNGIERLTGASRELSSEGFSSAPGFGRLFGDGTPHYATLIGLAIVATLVLAVAAAALWLGNLEERSPKGLIAELMVPKGRTVRWLVATLIVWLATAYVLFSFMNRLQPRYLEAMSPALAASFGLAAAYLLARPRPRLAPRLGIVLSAIVSLALLAVPAEASLDFVEERTSDANPTGSGSQFGAYLRTHRDGARYETAAANPLSVVGLISADAQPVLILRSIDGILVSVPQLRQLVHEGAVRFAIIPHPCSSGAHCTPTTAWSLRNSAMVRPGLYRYLPPSRLH